MTKIVCFSPKEEEMEKRRSSFWEHQRKSGEKGEGMNRQMVSKDVMDILSEKDWKTLINMNIYDFVLYESAKLLANADSLYYSL